MNDCYYYSCFAGRVYVWTPGQEPMLQYAPREIYGDTYALRALFNQPGGAVFVPWEVVQIVSNG